MRPAFSKMPVTIIPMMVMVMVMAMLAMMQIIMAFSMIPVTIVMQMLMMMIDDVDGDSDLLKDSSDNHSWVD